MRILVVNPALVRLQALGACEQDRLLNVTNLSDDGHEVRLITSRMPYQEQAEIESFYKQAGIVAQVISSSEKRQLTWRRFGHLGYLDGASWEYGQPEFLSAVHNAICTWQPQLVWCHTSYMWIPAKLARQHRVPTVIRSVNFEANQILQENAPSMVNRLRYLAKRFAEREALNSATVLAAITPDEQAIYHQMDRAAAVRLLPLRALPTLLREPRPAHAHKPLKVFFMGASYQVKHNLMALAFILEEIVPEIRRRVPGVFEFHILGSKVPAEFQNRASSDVILTGYVPDLDAYLNRMDIAIMPSVLGVGMQQKVFESLCRAFPTITHPRALAGYDFQDGTHLLTARNAAEYVTQLLLLQDARLRESLSRQVSERARALFGPESIKGRVREIIAAAVSGGNR